MCDTRHMASSLFFTTLQPALEPFAQSRMYEMPWQQLSASSTAAVASQGQTAAPRQARVTGSGFVL